MIIVAGWVFFLLWLLFVFSALTWYDTKFPGDPKMFVSEILSSLEKQKSMRLFC